MIFGLCGKPFSEHRVDSKYNTMLCPFPDRRCQVISLPADLADALEKYCAEHRITINQFLTQVLEGVVKK